MNTPRLQSLLAVILAIVVATSCTGALAGGTIGGNPDPIVREPILTAEEHAQGCRFMGWTWQGKPVPGGPLERWEYVDVYGSARNSGGLIEWRCPYPNVNHPKDGPVVVERRACVPARVSTEPDRDKPVRGGVYDHGVLVGCKR